MKGLIRLFIIGWILTGCSSTQKSTVSISPENARKNLAQYEKKASEKPGDVKALFRLAQAHAATGEFENALEKLDGITAIDPNFANAYLLRAEIYRKRSEKKEELRTYLALLALPHGHNYTEPISALAGMPYAIKPLNVGSGNNTLAKYSPDGRRIVWQSDRDGDWNIYMSASDGTGTQAITYSKGDDESPSFSPDNRYIVFTSHRDELEPKPLGDENREIYAFDLDARRELRLTKNKVDDWAPIYYPDSSTITFVSENESERSMKFIDRKSNLLVLQANGGVSSTLVANHFDNTSPGTLHDGRLAWVRINDGNYSIVAGNPGDEPEILYSSGFPISGLNASADGLHLAFFMEESGNIDIYQLDLAAKALTRLTVLQSREWFPAYSPDGSQILFSSDRHGKLGLFVLDLQEPISLNELRTRLQALLDQLETKQRTE
ncbi:MAG: tetratricopeptide repeat protein [bacterium]